MNNNIDNDTFKKCSCSKEFNNGYINVQRFVIKLDYYFGMNDLEGAKAHLSYWENEALINNNFKALLTILNEELGFARRINDKELAYHAIGGLDGLFDDERFNSPSYATIMVNMATSYSAFNELETALPIYEKAKDIFKKYNMLDSYEYASLLNNEATTLSDLKRYSEARLNIDKAIEILKNDKLHDVEIAVSLVNLAHITYDEDESNFMEVERLLDLAWKYINSENQEHDHNYAFQLSKMSPSFKYFNREVEAYALDEVVKEIYGE